MKHFKVQFCLLFFDIKENRKKTGQKELGQIVSDTNGSPLCLHKL